MELGSVTQAINRNGAHFHRLLSREQLFMEHLKEFNGLKVDGNQEIFGLNIEDGAEIISKTVAEFDGFRCQLWAPELHGIMIDAAVDFAVKAEKLRCLLVYQENPVSRCKELAEIHGNFETSFRVMQLYIATVAMSVSSMESWANKTIHSELKTSLEFRRTDDKVVKWQAAHIEKDAHLIEKIFTVIPLLWGLSPLAAHTTLRQRFIEIVDDRNMFLHVKNEPKRKGKSVRRMDIALKPLRRNAILVPKNTLALVKMLHDKAEKQLPQWLTGTIGKLEATEHAISKSSRDKR